MRYLPFAPPSLLSILVAALLAVVGSARAQNPGLLTPEQKLESGLQAYLAQNFPEADQLITEWLANFKASGAPESKMAGLDKIYHILAMSRIQQEKWEAAIPIMTEAIGKFPRGWQRDELSYMLGVAHFYTKKFDDAFKLLGSFVREYPKSKNRAPALLLMSATLLEQDKFKESAEFLKPLIGTVPADINGQMLTLRLHTLIRSEQLDEGLEVVRAFDSEDRANTRIAYFHLLALQLGGKLFAKKEYRKALFALQRVWPRERVIARQSGRLAVLEGFLDREKLNRVEERRLRDLVAQAQEGLRQFEAVPDYDTALNFRIAQCFTALDRHYEAALVYREMIARQQESELLESASIELLQSLARMESWPELIVESRGFEQRFPESGSLPQAIYLRGEALMRLGLYDQAAEAFLAVATRFPEHALAEQSHFQAGYSYLSLDENRKGIAVFDEHAAKFPKNALAEDVAYWRAMGLQFAQDYAASRPAFAKYLEDYPRGRFRTDAEYRMVFALYAQKQFQEAAVEAKQWLAAHPDDPGRDEALNLYGDALFATSRIDEGLAAYRSVSMETPRYYEYAAFRIGKALEAREEWDALREHFTEFMKKRPDSNRLAEAISELAKLHENQDEPEKARELYWEAIAQHGDDPDAAAVESLFENVGKLYGQAGEDEFRKRLAQLADEAGDAKPTLRARAQWMESRLLARAKPEQAKNLVRRYADHTKPTRLSPALLADAGDTLRAAGKDDQAHELYLTILRWYPRSLLKERAYAGMGLAAKAREQPDKALEYFAKFDRTGLDPTLQEQVLRARAEIYAERGDTQDAIAELERVLALPQAKGRLAAQTLYDIGHLHYESGDYKKAVAFLQRVYILYGRWTELVAKSYWESGQAFEKLSMAPEAVKTYAEFVGNETLAGTPEFQLAERRLAELPKPAPKEDPS